jgi:hypothetical protein
MIAIEEFAVAHADHQVTITDTSSPQKTPAHCLVSIPNPKSILESSYRYVFSSLARIVDTSLRDYRGQG